MLIKVGPPVDDIRTELLQNALDKLEAKLTNALKLRGALAAELGVDHKLLTGANAHIKADWDSFQAKMINSSDLTLLRQYHDDFLTLEGI